MLHQVAELENRITVLQGQARVLLSQRMVLLHHTAVLENRAAVLQDQARVLLPQRMVFLYLAAVLQYHNLIYAIKGKIFKSD